MWRYLVLAICLLSTGCKEEPEPVDLARAELCDELSDWVGNGDKWQFLTDLIAQAASLHHDDQDGGQGESHVLHGK